MVLHHLHPHSSFRPPNLWQQAHWTASSDGLTPSRIQGRAEELFRIARGLRAANAENGETEDDEDDDDDEPPSVNVADFKAPTSVVSYGLLKGRSSPSQRKAMGTSGSGAARIHICDTCGSEFVKSFGRCPTCKEWNTIREHVVMRQPPASPDVINPFAAFAASDFGTSPDYYESSPTLSSSGYSSTSSLSSSSSSSSSWLDGVSFGGAGVLGASPGPVRLTDLYDEEETDAFGGKKRGSSSSSSSSSASHRRCRQRRIVVPNDPELNAVLGGGLMKGSLLLVGGDPGVGKSTLMLQTAAAVASLVPPTPGIGMGKPSPAKKSKTEDDDVDVVVSGPVWYVSGEESPDQVASRASRLGIQESELYLLGETVVDRLCGQVATLLQQQQQQLLQQQQFPAEASSLYDDEGDDDDDDRAATAAATEALFRPKPPSLIVIDSLQTMVCRSGGTSSAGGITQVRECVGLLLRLAKSTGICVVLIGHVTKSGDVAGPRTVEHMVDGVLYLEGAHGSGSDGGGSGSSSGPIRILRASKNRFGSSEEVGIYEMTSGRLLPVSDPSSLFLANRANDEDVEGSATAIALEGMRAVTVEVQALVASTDNHPKAGYGRRTIDGISYARLNLLLGVLQKRCGFYLTRMDVYVNVIGQLRLDRGNDGKGGDLAVGLALVSSLASIPVRSDTAFVGEVGLLGELRPAPGLTKRLSEARRMGFSRLVTPRESRRRGGGSFRKSKKDRLLSKVVDGIEWIQCDHLIDAINAGLVAPLPKRRRKPSKSRGMSVDAVIEPGRLEDLELDAILDEADNDDDDDDDDDDDEPFA